MARCLVIARWWLAGESSLGSAKDGLVEDRFEKIPARQHGKLYKHPARSAQSSPFKHFRKNDPLPDVTNGATVV